MLQWFTTVGLGDPNWCHLDRKWHPAMTKSQGAAAHRQKKFIGTRTSICTPAPKAVSMPTEPTKSSAASFPTYSEGDYEDLRVKLSQKEQMACKILVNIFPLSTMSLTEEPFQPWFVTGFAVRSYYRKPFYLEITTMVSGKCSLTYHCCRAIAAATAREISPCLQDRPQKNAYQKKVPTEL